ncbi:STAS/SEC14 domain-containing protein [Pontibacter harenae]|uniref:STAS/SEC14 domain-containing protein n=1 Tax=Pontibacter harenae TaxID=2894083 RepID=UPI001E316890|nr:STAS/SEC14 domain-containing protein [Pontibacter harenae]MCC9167374.1 hypothetical protein [Pontibacter harenae]
MILYQNDIIKLEYAPAIDVLFIEWPDFQELIMPEVKASIKVLIENIRNYDVKYLLIDVSKSVVKLSGEEYKAIMVQFVYDLVNTTRLQKMARIVTTDAEREKRISEIRDETNPSFQYKTFTNREEAMAWLVEKPSLVEL